MGWGGWDYFGSLGSGLGLEEIRIRDCPGQAEHNHTHYYHSVLDDAFFDYSQNHFSVQRFDGKIT